MTLTEPDTGRGPAYYANRITDLAKQQSKLARCVWRKAQKSCSITPNTAETQRHRPIKATSIGPLQFAEIVQFLDSRPEVGLWCSVGFSQKLPNSRTTVNPRRLARITLASRSVLHLRGRERRRSGSRDATPLGVGSGSHRHPDRRGPFLIRRVRPFAVLRPPKPDYDLLTETTVSVSPSTVPVTVTFWPTYLATSATSPFSW